MYKKLSAKIISGLLVFFITICCSMTINTKTARAETVNSGSTITYDNKQMNVQILADNNDFKEVKVTSGTESSIVTYYKSTNQANLNGTTIINCNLTTSRSSSIMKNSLGSSYASGSDMSKAYSYTAFSSGWWYITAPNNRAKMAPETLVNPVTNEPNSTPFQTFRTSVNNLSKSEIEIVACFGTGVLSLIKACLATAPESLGATAVAALVIAAGAVITSVVLACQYYNYKEDCEFYYNRVKTYKTSQA